MLKDATTPSSLGAANDLVSVVDDVVGCGARKTQRGRLRVAWGLPPESQLGDVVGRCCLDFVNQGLVDSRIKPITGDVRGVTGRDDTRVSPFVLVNDGPSTREPSNVIDSSKSRIGGDILGLLEVTQ